MDFGKVGVGYSKSIPNKLTNFKVSSVTIVSIAGQDANFQITGITLPLVLSPGQEAQFNVQFQPSATGKPSTTISFGDNAQFVASMTVTGEGVVPGQLALDPSSLDFGNVKVGASQTSNVTLSNSGATDVNITQASLSGASFTTSNLALPLTLHPGSTAAFSVTFAPTGTGNFSGSVSFSANAVQNRAQLKNRAQPAQATIVVLALNGAGVNAGTLSANPTSVVFGSVQVGSSSSKSETLTNTGG
ncbi:MAG TPA: choice-of-anchor D domain-containing protein, partial [Terriglobales bacterium]